MLGNWRRCDACGGKGVIEQMPLADNTASPITITLPCPFCYGVGGFFE